MKKKFLVIVDKYFPSASANTMCMEENYKTLKNIYKTIIN